MNSRSYRCLQFHPLATSSRVDRYLTVDVNVCASVDVLVTVVVGVGIERQLHAVEIWPLGRFLKYVGVATGPPVACRARKSATAGPALESTPETSLRASACEDGARQLGFTQAVTAATVVVVTVVDTVVDVAVNTYIM